MKKKYFTFLYVPGHNSGVKTVRVPKLLVAGLAVSLVIVLASSTIAVLKYASKAADVYRLSSLERENGLLRNQLDELTQQIDVVKRQVQQNFDFQKKTRLLANLDELNDDVTEVGVGGPNYDHILALSSLDEATRGQINILKTDVDKLIRQTRLQTDSYQEIIDTLTINQKRLGATPSIRPVPHGYVSSRFGRRLDPFTGQLAWHLGIDYSVRQYTPIAATADGIVTYAGRFGAFGNMVEISHGFGFVTRYAHASKILVKKGQRVKRGDVVARVGSSGKSTAAHLHYEVIHDGKKKNPLAYIISGREIAN